MKRWGKYENVRQWCIEEVHQEEEEVDGIEVNDVAITLNMEEEAQGETPQDKEEVSSLPSKQICVSPSSLEAKKEEEKEPTLLQEETVSREQDPLTFLPAHKHLAFAKQKLFHPLPKCNPILNTPTSNKCMTTTSIPSAIGSNSWNFI